MLSKVQKRKQYLHYFYNYSKFVAKDFDDVLLKVSAFANEYGLIEEDLELITKVAFKQKLGSRRIRKVILSLIPTTYIPDTVTRIIIQWLLENYNNNPAKLSLKIVLQWLIGIVEYEIANKDIINLYYDLYFCLLLKEEITVIKLIYLLTKPSDVNRWYVKQVLHIHTKEIYQKQTGALLYLFKTYRPDCVPENVLAQAVQNVFAKIPHDLLIGFAKAKERIKETNQVPNMLENFMWNRQHTTLKRGKNSVKLIPNVTGALNEINIYSEDNISLLTVTNAKELKKYMLSSSTPSNVMSLLNNVAGHHVLAFSDNATQARFSYLLYHILYDALLQNNPNVSYEEKDYLLNQVAMFQVHIQQNVPVVSKFIAEYIVTWDGYDHSFGISQLIQFLNFTSYEELHDCILRYLHMIFISGTLMMKCNILKTLGDLIVNIIISYVYQSQSDVSSIFLDSQTEWAFDEVIINLYKYVRKLCTIGLYLENDHCLLNHCITHLHDKILSAESIANVTAWKILPYLSYSALFSFNPNSLSRGCDLLHRFPTSVRQSVPRDFMNCLWHTSIDDKDSFFSNISEIMLQFCDDTDYCKTQLRINNHFGFACYTYLIDGNNFQYQYRIADFIDYYTSLYEKKVGSVKRSKKRMTK